MTFRIMSKIRHTGCGQSDYYSIQDTTLKHPKVQGKLWLECQAKPPPPGHPRRPRREAEKVRTEPNQEKQV